jgi:hypothetical protein
MLRAWWNTNMDATTAISLLIAVVGGAMVALGMAASPLSWEFGTTTFVLAAAVLGAAIGGYRRHRVSDPARAQLWGLANGAFVAASLVAMFGMAFVIRPTVLGIPSLEAAWSVILMCGVLVGFVGALLWERDARRRRLAAPMLLGVWLIVGGIFARSSGETWASLAVPLALGGFSVLLLALVVSLRSSHRNTVQPDTWR